MHGVIEVLKNLTWPWVALVLGLLALILFRRPIANLIGRLLDQYMSFFISNGLATAGSGRYVITLTGIEFLTWMARTGRSEKRGL